MGREHCHSGVAGRSETPTCVRHYVEHARMGTPGVSAGGLTRNRAHVICARGVTALRLGAAAPQGRHGRADYRSVRQIAHIIVGVAFWVLMILLWWMLWAEHKATAAALTDTATRVGLCIGIVTGLTMWWVGHNVAIHRRKGPRRQRADVPVNMTSDRLGRRLVWDLPDGPGDARAAGHVVVELDGNVKTYRSAP